ncbi:MAG: biotin--[acetyl-CoA-carboxylase] ligase [Euryarchaeota archaeon]|jgi:BirA family biotin operon repressor/biotin-[acetyl-CoA-carboxylase] ligase|nr:biotin--[acetyl-CoA-carboxylase] ligase [Euryarchaeota archaeon]
MIIGRKVILKEEVPSTNDAAKLLALEGEDEGTVIAARRQTAGKGRLGRHWSSPEGGVYLSIILKPGITAGEMLRLTVMSGIPVADAISEFTLMDARLKWPNDVIVSGKKVAGLLMEASSKGSAINFLVLGIGINLNTDVKELEGENPGSLSEMAGHKFDHEAFLHLLLFKLDDFYKSYLKGMISTDDYLKRSSVIGRHVTGSVGDQRISGTAMYLDDMGALIIKGDDGLTYRLDSVYSLRYD